MSALVNHNIVHPSGMFVIDKDSGPQPVRELTPEAAQSEAERVALIAVTTPEQYDLAAAEMVRLKSLIKEAHDVLDPVCQAAHEAHREACSARAKVVDPLERACRELEPKIAAYLKRERELQEAEQQRLLEEARQDSLAAHEEQIEQAEANGATPDEVVALCERPLDITPVILPPARARGAVGLRDNHKGRVSDLMQLVQHVARHPEHVHLLCANETAINQLAKATRGALHIPGIEFYNEAGTSTRTAPRRGVRV